MKPEILIIGVLIGLLLNFSNIIDGVIASLIHKVGCVVYATCAFLWAVFAPNVERENWLYKKFELIGRKYYLCFFVFQYMTIECVKIFSSYIEFAYIDYIAPITVVILLLFESFVFELVKKYISMAYRYLREDN